MVSQTEEKQARQQLENYRLMAQAAQAARKAGQAGQADDLEGRLNHLLQLIDSLEEYPRCVLYHRFVIGLPVQALPEYTGCRLRRCRSLERQGIRRIAVLMRGGK